MAQAAVEADQDCIAIHVDFTNAYNSLSRRAMLSSVFSDSRLSHLWKVFFFCYGQPSHLCIRERGFLVDTILSQEGGKQGCVLAGLGFARAMQPLYEAAVKDLPAVTVRAIVDDFTLVGPPQETFEASASWCQRPASVSTSMQPKQRGNHLAESPQPSRLKLRPNDFI